MSPASSGRRYVALLGDDTGLSEKTAIALRLRRTSPGQTFKKAIRRRAEELHALFIAHQRTAQAML